MIHYRRDGVHCILKLFKVHGSVIPSSVLIALPCGIAAVILKVYASDISAFRVTEESGAWQGFNGLIGFLLIFRSSQAYSRFMDGCTATKKMGSEFFSACSSMIAFSRGSNASEDAIRQYQNLTIRMFSMLHAAAWAYIEENADSHDNEAEAYKFELIDAANIDDDSLLNLCDDCSKIELLYQWIQNLLIEAIDHGIVTAPSPIVSRCFQELSCGYVALMDASKVSHTLFPYPYVQMCETLLTFHSLMVPFVVHSWVDSPVWAFILTFVQVQIMWALNWIAIELENPFGTDANDLDGRYAQIDMNRRLIVLLRPHAGKVPTLKDCLIDYSQWDDEGFSHELSRKSLHEVWQGSESSSQGCLEDKKERLKTRSIGEHQDVNRDLSPQVSSKMPSLKKGMSTLSVKSAAKRTAAEGNMKSFLQSLPSRSSLNSDLKRDEDWEVEDMTRQISQGSSSVCGDRPLDCSRRGSLCSQRSAESGGAGRKQPSRSSLSLSSSRTRNSEDIEAAESGRTGWKQPSRSCLSLSSSRTRNSEDIEIAESGGRGRKPRSNLRSSHTKNSEDIDSMPADLPQEHHTAKMRPLVRLNSVASVRELDEPISTFSDLEEPHASSKKLDDLTDRDFCKPEDSHEPSIQINDEVHHTLEVGTPTGTPRKPSSSRV